MPARQSRKCPSLSVFLVAAATAWTFTPAKAIDIDWKGKATLESTFTVAPGQFEEVCGRLPKGVTIQWSFEAQGPADFNIHYHEGKDVTYPARESNVSRLAGELVTTSEQDYCWMWSNKATHAIEVRLALKR